MEGGADCDRNGPNTGAGKLRRRTKHGQIEKAARLSGPKLLQRLVAGGGFEPPTFGL